MFTSSQRRSKLQCLFQENEENGEPEVDEEDEEEVDEEDEEDDGEGSRAALVSAGSFLSLELGL